MKFKTKCPSCGNDIGIITIIAALSPFSFKCSSCKTRIRIRGIFKLIFINFTVTGLCAVFTLQYFVGIGVLDSGEYAYLLIPVFIIILMEIIRALLVCNKATPVYDKKDES
ncbi:MAG: hypothetical protein COV35_03760 [Alphaproteobacteria bacterium CG11_big_fil_rev_8_21_14_0_20_39_49]|nr:MAG: hypothetical protein COV35_03760 [Alphaproteobacteria bacterium CG11_big_fil_rev_8_21_14_0_20_39_49]